MFPVVAMVTTPERAARRWNNCQLFILETIGNHFGFSISVFSVTAFFVVVLISSVYKWRFKRQFSRRYVCRQTLGSVFYGINFVRNIYTEMSTFFCLFVEKNCRFSSNFTRLRNTTHKQRWICSYFILSPVASSAPLRSLYRGFS